MILDETVYKRMIQRVLTKKYGEMEDLVPNEYKKIETYDLATKTMGEEDFYVKREGLEFLFIPPFLDQSLNFLDRKLCDRPAPNQNS